jgi:SAM-dependent methyltransferase
MLLGEICRLQPEMRQLDLCCGKAEMLCQWSKKWGMHGVGVDISPIFLAAARERVIEMGVASQITLIEADAGTYVAEAQHFDIVSCIGATWIGQGLVGTLKLMQAALKPGGLLLVGEPYWVTPPPDAAYTAMGIGKGDYVSLISTLDRIASAGFELVEMVLASQDSWDRYVAAQWWAVHAWLRANPHDPYAAELREMNAREQRTHLEYQRNYLGWGVFVLRER